MSAPGGKAAMLLRRELWEHRALWLAPAVVAAILIITLLVGGNSPMFAGVRNGVSVDSDADVPVLMQQLFGHGVMIVLTMTLGAVAAIAAIAYLLDCLYAERKDRSILFWKSLPVSDAQTVLAKFGVAVLLVPLLTALLAAVAQPLVLLALQLRFQELRPVIGMHALWGGIKALPQLGVVWLYCVLWYAPLVAYLMLASVLARRVPLMYAVMPPALLILVEGLTSGSGRVLHFVGEQLAPWLRDDWSWRLQRDAAGRVTGIGAPDWSALLQNPSLWLGLAAAAGMVYIVIRLRRYRDDT